MIKFIVIMFLLTSPSMVHNPTELNAADLIECVGKSFNEQKVFASLSFREPSSKEIEEYAPAIISKTLKTPRQYTLFGIPVDEVHLALDSQKKILAVFIRLDNQDLVKKMKKAIGDEYIAGGTALGEDEVIPHHYEWDYKGGCISLMLNAYGMMRYLPKILRDDGLVTFFNCDPGTYYDLSGPFAETNYVQGANPEIDKQREYFLKLAYSFYPKGMSDTDDLYGMTPEFRRLLDTLHKHEYLDKKWELLLSTLNQRFECIEVGIPDPIVRGYRIAIKLKSPQPHNIVVNISKLIPSFCFYTASDNPKSAGRAHPRYFKFNNFTSADNEVVSWIRGQIQLHFEGYKEFPPELVFSDVEDTEFDMQGFLLRQKEYSSYFRSMTLFNAFFSSNTFYW
jgi:hypothetical protein